MIKLERENKPTFLSDSKVDELTNEFKVSGTTVWNNSHIKDPLLISSFGKCAYCECPLTTQSNYMEVEHFEDKKHNPDKVVLWENLLPSCKKCNGSKGGHDVISEPIVNPYNDYPKDHLLMRLYRFRPKTEKGKNTIEVTNLNHSSRLVVSRFEIGEKIDELIDTAIERFEMYVSKKNTRTKNRVVKIVESMLEECQPTADYSASTATNLLSDQKFLKLIESMKTEDIWTQDLGTYYSRAMPLVLECA